MGEVNMKKKINSRQKGAAAEREVANLLKSYGYEARRGQQFSGGGDSPDVVAPDFPFHIEVKRVENLSLYKAMAQAVRDSKDLSIPPLVIHRRSNEKWVAILHLEDLISLLPERQKTQVPILNLDILSIL